MAKSVAQRVGDAFDRLATRFGKWMGNPITFLIVFVAILAWTIVGFFMGFASEWLSTMHMTGPVVTLLLVFLLQHGQAKNTRALQLKLDELLATQKGTRKETIKSEDGLTGELERLEKGRGRPRKDGPGNVQDAPAGAPKRRTGHASKRPSKADRDPRKR